MTRRNVRQQNAERRLRHATWERDDRSTFWSLCAVAFVVSCFAASWVMA
jgi:hypothetical protein